MFENLRNGWKLAGATRKLVFSDRRLLLYPVLSAVIGIALALLIFVPMIIFSANAPEFIAALIVFYIVTAYAATYTLMALLVAFRSHAKGMRISMGDALRQTSQYALLILEWALFYTLLVMILRAIESRFRGVSGLIIGGIGSMAIAAATLFAVPVILDNKVGPIKAVEDSVKMIVHHFGNAFGGVAYSDIYGLLFAGPGILLLLVDLLAASALGVIAAIAVGVAGLLLIVVGLLISYTTRHVFTLILYDYVQTGKLPKGFDKDIINAAVKRGKRGGASGGAMPTNTFA